MANLAISTRFAHCKPLTTPIPAPIPPPMIDQVDDSTSTQSLIFKQRVVNRMNDKYHREDERLRTFETWPHPWLNKFELAMTGMFYTNEEDKVKCYFCEVEIGRWEREDQPVPEHLRWSPNCPLLRRRTTNNLPLNIEALERILPPISYDICGSNDTSALDVREHAISEGRQSTQPVGVYAPQSVNSTLPVQEPCSRPGAAANGGNYFPEYPEYAIETARLRSFEDWPRNLKQKPQQLAEAGFFYTGVGDRVRCFSCGGGLKDWNDNDEPWEQHALWLSQCRFVKLIKGRLYIDSVIAAAQNAKPGQEDTKQESNNSSPNVNSINNIESNVTVTAAAAATSPASVLPTVSNAAAAEEDVFPATASLNHDKALSQNTIECKSGQRQASCPPALPEEKLCKICYGAEYNTAFLPCGHVVACAKCASSVTKCPLCRKPFTDVMRVYFS